MRACLCLLLHSSLSSHCREIIYHSIQESLCEEMEGMIKKHGLYGSWRRDGRVSGSVIENACFKLKLPKCYGSEDWEIDNLNFILDSLSLISPHVIGKV